MSEYRDMRIELCQRRCYDCGRFSFTEANVLWSCGNCAEKRIQNLLNDIKDLERSNAALRGALKKKSKA